MAPQPTQAALPANSPTVTELEAKIHQLFDKLDSTSNHIAQQLAEQATKQETSMMWVRETLEKLCREKQT